MLFQEETEEAKLWYPAEQMGYYQWKEVTHLHTEHYCNIILDRRIRAQVDWTVLLLRASYIQKIFEFTRQWPEVYDLCHTFLHVVQVTKPTAMWESHARITRDSSMVVELLTHTTCRNVRKNLIPCATAQSSQWGSVLIHKVNLWISLFLIYEYGF